MTVRILPSLQRLFRRKPAATPETPPASPSLARFGSEPGKHRTEGAVEQAGKAAGPHAGHAGWWSSEMADDAGADPNVEETAPAVLYSDHLLPDLPKGKH